MKHTFPSKIFILRGPSEEYQLCVCPVLINEVEVTETYISKKEHDETVSVLLTALTEAECNFARIYEADWDENQMRLCAEAAEGRVIMALDNCPAKYAKDKP